MEAYAFVRFIPTRTNPLPTLDDGRSRARRDPSVVHLWLRKIWQQLAIYTNWPALAAIAVLTAIGVISIWADPRADGAKQLQFVGISIVFMALLQAANYQFIGRFAWGFYAVSL